MKSVKTMIFLFAGFLIASIATLIFFYKPVTVFIFARANHIDIEYKKLNAGGINEFVFEGLKAVGQKKGMGLYSSNARIKFIFNGLDLRNTVANFTLKDVRFINKGIEKETSYSNIDGLVAIPFSSLWSYKEVSGKIGLIQDGICIKNFIATGDIIKFSFDGTLTRDQNINADIGVYFAEKLTGKIPPDLTNMVLKDEGVGWKSLKVKLEGDLAKPSISVTGKLFRLNIGVKSENPS